MQQIVNSTPQPTAAPTPVKSGSNTTVIIAIIVILIIVAGICIAVWMKKRKENGTN